MPREIKVFSFTHNFDAPMPQIVDFGGNVSQVGPNDYNKYYDLLNSENNDPPFYEKAPSWTPNLDYFIYYKRAKKFRPSDVMNAAYLSYGILVSERFKNFLQSLKLSKHVIMPLVIKHKEEAYDYYFFQFYHHNLYQIDFEKSTFYLTDPARTTPFEERKFKEVKISSFSQFKERVFQAMKLRLSIKSDDVYFKPSFDQDVFHLGYLFSTEVFFTENVLKKIKENGFIDVAVSDCPKLEFNISES